MRIRRRLRKLKNLAHGPLRRGRGVARVVVVVKGRQTAKSESALPKERRNERALLLFLLLLTEHPLRPPPPSPQSTSRTPPCSLAHSVELLLVHNYGRGSQCPFIKSIRGCHLVANLGWVDFDVGCSTILPTCSATYANLTLWPRQI